MPDATTVERLAGSEAVARLWQLGQLVTPMALRVAATLGIADLIAGGVGSVEGLARACGADAGALGKVLRHLAARGVFREIGPGTFALTELGEVLRDDHPRRMRLFLDTTTAMGRAELAAVHLLHSVRTGRPAYPVLYGRGFWDDLDADQGLSRTFAEQMSLDLTANRLQAIEHGFRWQDLGTLVDVGGGAATLLIALLRAYPGLRGTVLDLPGAAQAARSALAEAGLADRGDVVEGSFFDPLPAGADAYLLSYVLHDWDDASCGRILARVREAAAPGGRVVVLERVGAEGRVTGTGMDLRMLLNFQGRERDAADLCDLVGVSGFEQVRSRVVGDLAVVEGTVPR